MNLKTIYEDSVLQKAVGFAARKIAQKLADGYEIEQVSSEEQQRRIEICNVCPRLNAARICNECSCPMDYKTHLKYNPFMAALGHPKELVICPLKKW